MRKMLFTVLDKKAGVYGTPFPADSVITAQRNMIHSLIHTPKSAMNTFPGDFDLYNTGVFFEETGTIDPITPPAYVCGMQELAHEARQISNQEAQ